MKSRIYSSLILFFTAIFLGSCSYFSNYGKLPVNYSTASKVRMNDSFNEVNEKLDFSKAKQIEVVDSDNSNRFKILICERSVRLKTNSYIFFGKAEQYDFFVYAFLNESLYFWGNLDDFKRCDDDKINTLGIKISNYIIEKGL